MKNFLLADDQAIVRSGLKSLIRENFNVCKLDEAENQQEVMKLVRNNVYDILILDISMDGKDFLHIMRWMAEVAPDTRVLIFTMQSEAILGRTCLQLGASGFISKVSPVDEIVFVINRLLNGQKYVSPLLAASLVHSINEKRSANPFQNLSARELEIVLLLGEGRTLVEICALLHIEYSTVNTHKRKIFEKLMVDSIRGISMLMQTFNIRKQELVAV